MAIVVMARTSLRQPPPGKTLVRWVIVLVLCAAQVSCWGAAEGFGRNVGGGSGNTGELQLALIGVGVLWLMHQVWRLLWSRR